MIDREMSILASVAAKNASTIVAMRLANANLADQQALWTQWYDFCLASLVAASTNGGNGHRPQPQQQYQPQQQAPQQHQYSEPPPDLQMQEPTTTNDPRKSCPKCGGPTWDNRQRKAEGLIKATAPNYSCRDRNGCAWHSGFVNV